MMRSLAQLVRPLAALAEHPRLLWPVVDRARLLRQKALARLRPQTPMTGRMVDFILCGAQKAGTSALAAYLREHPGIFMPAGKEVHFFDNDYHFRTGKADYSAYHAEFTPARHHQRVGEATPIYMYWRGAVDRIWQYNPSLKLIVVLRNPIERAFSHWNMERSRGWERLSFWEALHCEETRHQRALPQQDRVFSYVGRGYYSEQLSRIWARFPVEQVLVLKSDALRHQPMETVRRVCAFLELHPPDPVTPRTVNAVPYQTAMQEREKDFLRRAYREEIPALEQALGWNCQDWLVA
jgi:hypothetical protein